MQEFNIIVEDSKAIHKLRKHIKKAVPHFKGIKKWLVEDVDTDFQVHKLDGIKYQYRFLTITFDPRKFTFNELTQPIKLIRYAKNALKDLENLFKGKPIIIVEYHKSGVPHLHINYECEGPLEHATLILRLRYFFSESLKNKSCIHDRMANEGCIQYMKKANTEYFTFK